MAERFVELFEEGIPAPIQDSFNKRALSQARVLAEKLIDEHGKLHKFEQPLRHPYLPLAASDGVIWEHQSRFLKRWNEDRQLQKKIGKFSLPLCHTRAEEMVRLTLQLPSGTSLKDFHVSRAVLVACLTPLRQSVGSCFATAPAILVQRHFLDLFLDDLTLLLMKGKLQRVIDGVDYSVPLSLALNPLHQAWEFALASFCDIKKEFTQWNVSWSIGLDPREKSGIGSMLVEALEQKLQEANEKIQEYHTAATEAFDQFKAAEALLNRASTEAEMRRYKAEVQARYHHLRSCEDQLRETQAKAKVYAGFFNFLVNQYTARFQDYFQEIYDPEMPEHFTGVYEDRMAGFRLVFNHGRRDSSLWTAIYTPEQFVQSLVEFFTLSETAITYILESEEEKEIVQEMTTLVIQHVRSDLFLKMALSRAAERKRTPWAYLSGGTMDQLVPIYFRMTTPMVKEQREIHDELDLFVFLLETLKSLPSKATQSFLTDPTRGLLMESPTHVFSVLPGSSFFQQGWLDTGFTYTWIRDQFIQPAKEFYSEMRLSREEQLELMRRLSLYGETSSSASIETFCARFPELPRKELAAFLYRMLPLVRADQCKSVLQQLVESEVVMPKELPPFLSSEEIQLLAKSMLRQDVDRHAVVADRARALKLAPPICIFADTNWPEGYFAFVINPISLELEVWKTDLVGSRAASLPLVKSWLGKGKQFTWIVYINIF